MLLRRLAIGRVTGALSMTMGLAETYKAKVKVVNRPVVENILKSEKDVELLSMRRKRDRIQHLYS